jgi:hypothetical protein
LSALSADLNASAYLTLNVWMALETFGDPEKGHKWVILRWLRKGSLDKELGNRALIEVCKLREL